MTKILAALDCGNGNTKVKLYHPERGEVKVSIPSALMELSEEDADDCAGAFTYLSGSNCIQRWLPGTVGGDHRWAMDSLDGKVKFALPLLLSAIDSHVEDGDEIAIAASTHSVAALGDSLKAALQGEHIYQVVGGNVKGLTIQVHRVVSEGVGAIFGSGVKTAHNYLLDLGTGTAIGSIYQQLKLRPGCLPYTLDFNGSRRLISEVAKCATTTRLIGTGQTLTFEQAKEALERKNHVAVLAGRKIDITPAVTQETQRWVDDVVRTLEGRAAHHLMTCQSKLATGGAILIPEVAKLLKGHGYQLINDPLFANANGMLSLLRKAIG
jgi:hypothetical protein